MSGENKQARPWDIFNKNLQNINPEDFEKRMSICKECPEFIKLTQMCKECGCYMPSKTKSTIASCPIGKWGPVPIKITE